MRSYGSCLILLLLVLSLSAQPVVNAGGVVNAASYTPVGLPDYGIAQGSIFMVFGTAMGPPQFAEAPGFPLQTELAGTSINVTVKGTTVKAIILRSAATWAQAIMPSNTPTGEGTLTVTYNGKTSAPVALRVVKSAFGIFTRNQAGSGPASLQNFNSDLDRPANSHIEAAKPGQVVTLWGTGLGPVSFDETMPPQTGDLEDVPVEVLVSGRSAEILYKGRSSQFPGLDQINFVIPENVGGCYSPIAVKINDMVSNYATASIYAQNTLCADSDSFGGNNMEALKRNGDFRIGGILLKRYRGDFETSPSGPMQLLIDFGDGRFSQYDQNGFLAANPFFDVWGRAASCHVESRRMDSVSDDDHLASDPTPRGALDSGASLTISGPQGTHDIARSGEGYEYEEELGGTLPGEPAKPAFLEPGEYTLAGHGGRDVGPFTATLTVPSAVTWSNQAAIGEIDRKEDLRIEWTGGGDPATERVIIIGASADTASLVRGAFTCVAPAAWGAAVVPSTVLGSLPASSEWKDSAFPTGALMVGNVPLLLNSRFAAPGLDVGYFAYALFTLMNVTFR